jgi:hypothetical protein
MKNEKIQSCEVTSISAHLLQNSRRRFVYANPAKSEDIASIIGKTYGSSDNSIARTVMSVSKHNPNMVWSVHSGRRPIGLILVWLLNNYGLYNYFNKRLDLQDARLDHFASRSEPVTAVAVDHLIGARATFLGLIDVIPWLRTLNGDQLDIWTTPQSIDQTNLAHMLGFQPLSFIRPDLMHLLRHAGNL